MIRALLQAISLLYQFRPTHTDKFRHFIFHADSSAYGENRQNGGLTRFWVGAVLEDIFPPSITSCAEFGLYPQVRWKVTPKIT
jgi:hypothetical protein